MALPTMYDKPKDYFHDCIQFFQDYQYLYKAPNTDILVNDILDQININNLDNIDIYKEDCKLEDVKDEFLEEFFERLNNLKPIYNDFDADESLQDFTNAPLTLKKKHEVIYLAREIKNVCKEANCNLVVDFGSGLGYLDQQIFETTDLKVLALECNEQHYVSAKKRQSKYHEKSIQKVKYIRHTITEDSDVNLDGYLKEKFGNPKDFCIAGLHACGDLTVDAINIFLKMDTAKALVLMSCCYHKLQDDVGIFDNIPLSECLLDAIFGNRRWSYINVPFLRLAAQPPNHSDKIEDLIFNLLARAVLEVYACRHNCVLKRKKRKAVNTKMMKNNFESYLHDACTNGFKLLKDETHPDPEPFNVEEILLIWRQMPHLTFKKAGVYILLQKHLQPVFENFILYDRIVYLHENGIKNCEIRKIFNERISPRCTAILAYK